MVDELVVWVDALLGGVVLGKQRVCSILTNSLVSIINRLSCCWWMAKMLALAETSNVSCWRAAGWLKSSLMSRQTGWDPCAALLKNKTPFKHSAAFQSILLVIIIFIQCLLYFSPEVMTDNNIFILVKELWISPKALTKVFVSTGICCCCGLWLFVFVNFQLWPVE